MLPLTSLTPCRVPLDGTRCSTPLIITVTRVRILHGVCKGENTVYVPSTTGYLRRIRRWYAVAPVVPRFYLLLSSYMCNLTCACACGRCGGTFVARGTCASGHGCLYPKALAVAAWFSRVELAPKIRAATSRGLKLPPGSNPASHSQNQVDPPTEARLILTMEC